MRTRLLLLLLATCVAFSAVGCGQKDATSSGGGTRKILRLGNSAEPSDLDPQTVTGVPEYRLGLALFEGLVSQDPDLEVIPGVAERWDISPDGRIYTFHLRGDARWSNGEPITAHDFVRSYRRMLTPSLAAEYAYMLWHVVGAEDYYRGNLTDFDRTGFKALDARTLQLTLRQRVPFLLRAMSHQAWYPVHIPTVEKFGGLERKSTAWTRPENFVGNGPYHLREWQPGQRIVVERSPTYWDRDRVKIDELHFMAVELAETEERMFRTGQLDMTYEVPLTKIPVYRREMPEALRIAPYLGVYFYRFNVARKPFDDVRVRRALALAVDRESLVRNVLQADEQPAYHVIPPDTADYTSRHRFDENLAEARRLLAEAGFPEGRGFPRVELLYNTLEKHRIVAETIQQMWRRNLGVEITLHNQEWKVYMDSQHSKNFELQRGGWIADYVDPHVFLDLWQTDGGNNDTNWGDPEYDRLLRAALDAPTDKERYEIYQQMEKILLDAMPIMPLFFYTNPRLISPKVKGYYTTVLDNYPWKYADLEL